MTEKKDKKTQKNSSRGDEKKLGIEGTERKTNKLGLGVMEKKTKK